jgi:hypothetical protein
MRALRVNKKLALAKKMPSPPGVCAKKITVPTIL